MKFIFATILTAGVIGTPLAKADDCNRNFRNQRHEHGSVIETKGTLEQLSEDPSGNYQVRAYAGKKEKVFNWGEYYYTSPWPTYRVEVKDASGKRIFQLKTEGDSLDPHTLSLNRTVFSPDGKKVLLVMDDPHQRSYFGRSHRFTLVDLQTGKAKVLEAEIELGGWKVYRDADRIARYPVTFSQDSQLIYLTDEYGVQVVSAETGKPAGMIGRETVGYKDGRRALDAEVKKYGWEPGDGTEGEYNRLKFEEGVYAVSYSPDRSRVLLNFRNDAPVLYDLASEKVVGRIAKPKRDSLTQLTLVGPETVIGLQSGGEERVMRWNLRTGKSEAIYSVTSRKKSVETVLSRNGVTVVHVKTGFDRDSIAEEFFAYDARGKTVAMDTASTKFLDDQYSPGLKSSSLELSADGRHLLVRTAHTWSNELKKHVDSVFLFNTKSGKVVKRFPAGGSNPNGIWFSEDGKSVFFHDSSQEGNTVQKIDLRKARGSAGN